MELRRAAGHVVEDRVQARQPTVDLLAVPAADRRRERLQVVENVREHQAGQVRVPDPGAEHVLHCCEGAVAKLAELVDGLPVPVPRQASGPGRVLQPVHHPVFGQRVQLLPEAAIQPRRLIVGGCQLGEGRRHLVAVCLGLVHRAEPVQRSQHPQVGDVVITPGEVEQPESVADSERVKVQ
jgi:hypothetical protein